MDFNQKPGPVRIRLFADGASIADLRRLAQLPMISGFTTNPTLMRQAGIQDYREFARAALAEVGSRPISFEVFADTFPEMIRQAREIAKFGPNVYVKIPITNTRGESALSVVRELSTSGVHVNVTAICTLDQVRETLAAVAGGAPSVISVFAGRIADTGRDPVPLMRAAAQAVAASDAPAELLWASPRELLNIFHAQDAGCQIITLTPDVLKKLDLIGKDLGEFSLDTVRMFHRDATTAGYVL
jgi:transaldolase